MLLLRFNYLKTTMGGVQKYLFCVLTVIVGISFAHGYDTRTNYRKIIFLDKKLEYVITKLEHVEEYLKAEKERSVILENQLKTLKDETKVTTLDNSDSDLPKHESVVDQQRTVDKVFSTIEQRVYQAMNDDKNVRKQFQNQMQTAFKTEKENMEIKFTSLNITLSGVIDKKLQTIEDKVLDSVTVLNNSIADIADLKSNVRQNEEAITFQRVQSDQLNTTLYKHILYSLNDSHVDVQASVEKQLDNSHRFNVCLHGGKHTLEGACECRLPYYGTYCEKVCLHGGKHTLKGVCECCLPYYGTYCEKAYVDCYDIHKQTDNPSGIYKVQPRGLNETIKVQCDMTTNGGGWTVFQYRYDGSVAFYKNFRDYETGFGNLTGEFWLGLRYIQAIASTAPTMLRIDLEAADGEKYLQKYEYFSLSEGPDYKLNVLTSSGGGYFGLSSNNVQFFTTYDRDRDGNTLENCAELYHGGWWYSSRCGWANLNGHYTTPGTTSNIGGSPSAMFYYSFKKVESLKTSKMMLRRK